MNDVVYKITKNTDCKFSTLSSSLSCHLKEQRIALVTVGSLIAGSVALFKFLKIQKISLKSLKNIIPSNTTEVVVMAAIVVALIFIVTKVKAAEDFGNSSWVVSDFFINSESGVDENKRIIFKDKSSNAITLTAEVRSINPSDSSKFPDVAFYFDQVDQINQLITDVVDDVSLIKLVSTKKQIPISPNYVNEFMLEALRNAVYGQGNVKIDENVPEKTSFTSIVEIDYEGFVLKKSFSSLLMPAENCDGQQWMLGNCKCSDGKKPYLNPELGYVCDQPQAYQPPALYYQSLPNRGGDNGSVVNNGCSFQNGRLVYKFTVSAPWTPIWWCSDKSYVNANPEINGFSEIDASGAYVTHLNVFPDGSCYEYSFATFGNDENGSYKKWEGKLNLGYPNICSDSP